MSRSLLSVLVAGTMLFCIAPPAGARVASWVKPAVTYVDNAGIRDASRFHGQKPMRRATFTKMMKRAFGGYYHRAHGKVRAVELARALVGALHERSASKHLNATESPDGWDPSPPKRFGVEVVSREMGLRHDWPTTDERFEASSNDHITQADITWAIWQAKTSPDTWAADPLRTFSLPTMGRAQHKVVRFAMSLTGHPYIWGGEWANVTYPGYPYGAQAHGGFDCSGFVWYVMQRKSSSYRPARHYRGWRIQGRSSAQMAAETKRRLSYRHLRPGDLVFFAGSGRKSSASEVYHVGIFLGHGWMIDSSGSNDGISVDYIGRGSWWHSQIAWGRRVIH